MSHSFHRNVNSDTITVLESSFDTACDKNIVLKSPNSSQVSLVGREMRLNGLNGPLKVILANTNILALIDQIDIVSYWVMAEKISTANILAVLVIGLY